MSNEKESKDQAQKIIEHAVKHGTVNILALGYRGVEAWRKNRETKKEGKA